LHAGHKSKRDGVVLCRAFSPFHASFFLAQSNAVMELTDWLLLSGFHFLLSLLVQVTPYDQVRLKRYDPFTTRLE